MAESLHLKVSSENCNSNTNNENLANLECAVCLQTCIHPAELPCGHIFCYLCIKGIVNQGRRCAMCRQDIPIDYLDKPRLLKPMEADVTSQGFEDGHLWFYEGHNGWWQYDERTCLELEFAYQKGERSCELLIAGLLYVVDFDGMLQYRCHDPSRRRRIKRDLASTTKKGIAGLKATKNGSLITSNLPENISNEIIQNSPVINASIMSSSRGVRSSTSNLIDFAQHTESLQTQRLRERSVSEYPTCRTTCPITSHPQTDYNSRHSFNLESTEQNTLDWTVEQIESLNLEVLNDYENLVQGYEQSEGSIYQRRINRTPNNYLNRSLNVSHPSNESLGNGWQSTPEAVVNQDNENSLSSEPLPNLSDRMSIVSPRVNETESDRLLPSMIVNIPTPSGNRGMSRPRSRRDFSTLSSNLHCDTFFQRFISNK